MRRGAAVAVAVVLCAGVVALLVVERSEGAADYGSRALMNPCSAPADPRPGGGLDASIQRIVLSGLNGAACDLGTTRETLVLSLAPGSAFDDVTWDRATAERALRRGLERAIDDAEDRGTLPAWVARAAHLVVDRAPLSFLLQALEALG